jgi:WD40 repeat protein
VAVTSDGRRAISVSADVTIVWDLEGGAKLCTLREHRALKALTSDGQRAISVFTDDTLKVWDVESGAELRTLPDRGVLRAMTPDGRRAIFTLDDNTLRVWDLESRRELSILRGHKMEVNDVAVTPDGQRVVSASEDDTLKVWDLESGAELRTLPGVQGQTGSRKRASAYILGSFSTGRIHELVGKPRKGPLHRFIATIRPVFKHKAAKRTLEQIRMAVAPQDSYTPSGTKVAVTSDGRRAVLATWSPGVMGPDCYEILKVWDLESGAKLHSFQNPAGCAHAMAIAPDGGRAIFSSDTLRVWDLENGAEQVISHGHTPSAFAVAVTPDGQRAVTVVGPHRVKVGGPRDTTLKVWDLHRGELIASFFGESELQACAIVPDGMTIVAGEQSGQVHILRLEGLEQSSRIELG